MNILQRIGYWVIAITIISIFFGGVIYCVYELIEAILLRDILFWSALILLFLSQIQRGMEDLFAKKGEAE